MTINPTFNEPRVSNLYLGGSMHKTTAPRSWKSTNQKLQEQLKRGAGNIPSRKRVLVRSGIKLPLYYNAYTGEKAETKIDMQKWKTPKGLNGPWVEVQRRVVDGQEYIIMSKHKKVI